ncbi:MAG: T9SS type B sorting domain-containing protein [Aureispira sp.]
MKQQLTLLLGLLLWSCPIILWGQELTTTSLHSSTTSSVTPPTITLTTTNVTCFGANDGCVTALVTGSSIGQLSYVWSTGDTTSTVCGLAGGQYFVTVTDTVAAIPPSTTNLYAEDFDGTHNWSLSNATGTNSANSNVWQVNDEEGGVAPTNCGVGNNGDSTLHITCTSLGCGLLFTGSAYNATETSNVRAESPTFSTIGFSGNTLTFDFIANGDALLDNASLWYNAGAGWVVLDPSLKSTVCPGGQGEWTAYTIVLPAACDNNATVQLGFNWTNNADNVGTDPSVAINNIVVSHTTTGSGVQICTVVADTTITAPQFLLVNNIDSLVGATCAGDSNGLVHLAVSGGIAPYRFLWSNGATTQNITNLAEGLYTVTITDNNNCINVDTALVPLLGLITVTIDSTVSPFCNGDSTGAIFATAIGDTTLNNCSSPVVRLNEFLYRPTAAFNNGRDPNTGEFIELIGPPGADISCYVLSDGDWTITLPAGTTIPSDGFFTIGNDVVWGAGTFDLDAENCNCFTEGPTGSGTGLLILTDGGETIAIFDATGSFVDGVVYGNPSNGNQPYGSTINTIGLTGCVSAVTFPAASAYSTAPGGLQPNTSLVRAPDGSGSWVPQVDGSLNACNNIGGNGAGNITYLWSNGDTTQNISGVPAGTYTVIATNALGCMDTASFTLVDSSSLMATAVGTNIACMGDSTGSIDLTVTGGANPYTFLWSNGATTEDLGNVPTGIYCGTITDNNGCTIVLCDTLLEDSLDIPFDTLYICAGDSVQLLVNTTVQNIQWSPATGLSNDTIIDPFARPTGTTTYVVRDITSSCMMMDSVVVVVGGAASLVNLGMATEPNCFGDTTGSIITTSSNTNLAYWWNNGDTTANLNNVPAGMYTLIATDSSNCVDTLVVMLNQPDSLQLSIGGITNVTCRSGNDGAIGVTTVLGGVAGYSYLWSDAAASTTDSLDNLSAGLYLVTVTDANGCIVLGSATVNEPIDSISIGFNATPVSCGNTNDGMVTALPINGTPTYTYQWDASTNNQTGATATGLSSGTYSVVVTDALGCTATALGIFVPINVAIDTNSISLVALDSVLDCTLMPTGTLRINTVNNYTYLWSNGTTNQQADNLAEGAYAVTVSNSQNCSVVLYDTITAPFVPSILPYITVLNNVSSTGTAGEVFNIGAGNDQTNLGVQYDWTVNDPIAVIVNPLLANSTVSASTSGTYVLTLTATANDAEACQDTGSVTLTIESIYLGMPTAFTPNNDGFNDLYRPIGLLAEDVIRFKIYNRWGQIVYDGDDLENGGWDGRFDGIEQPTEEYVFVLEYKIGTQEPQARKGGFTLIR